MTVKVEWRGQEFESIMHRHWYQILYEVTGTVARYAKAKCSVAGYGIPSKKGNYPHKQTGDHRKFIEADNVDMSILTARVGSNLDYAKWLEVKTPARGGRPWLSRAIEETKAKTRRIFARKVRGA